jgi:hypothetical protein
LEDFSFVEIDKLADKLSFETNSPNPDSSGNPFVRRGGQKIETDSGISS